MNIKELPEGFEIVKGDHGWNLIYTPTNTVMLRGFRSIENMVKDPRFQEILDSAKE